ncbi:hypothetical protein [Haladaptatus halobius]|uniref:hypothetical protein n=1 Tax=Haladaptatus halobius TaxID=2884875 RepID=UPI001D09E0FF|nr:hypothetical protein [Haladaptatus halobius]
MLTIPTPPDSLPKYLAEGLQKQDVETLNDVEAYTQELRLYRAAQAHATRALAAEDHDVDPVTADELAEKVHAKDIPEDAIDWDEISPRGCQRRRR